MRARSTLGTSIPPDTEHRLWLTWASKIFRDWWMQKYGRKMRRGDTISDADALTVLKAVVEAEDGPPMSPAWKSRRLWQ
jgi:hypothetical protein